MEKKMIIFGIIALLICVGLSGCFGADNNSGNIIGNWVNVNPNDYVFEVSFWDDGTAYIEPFIGDSILGSYIFNETNIEVFYTSRLLDGSEYNSSINYSYRFSDGNLILNGMKFKPE